MHPKLLDAVNQAYTPSAEALARAQRLVISFEAALARGEGAIKLDGVMVDKPVYRRALDLIAEA